MSTTDNGGPAFPHTLQDLYEPNTAGMTLRDYFAAKALQGLLASPGAPGSIKAAEIAYCMADAMLRARGAA